MGERNRNSFGIKQRLKQKFILSRPVICTLMLLTWISYAQQYEDVPNLQFETFVIEDGFASVNCILKDQKGFSWFGGTHGLYRHDGYSFKIFRHEEDAKSLSNDHVTYLFEDSNGFIWIGTLRGGLNRFDPITEEFVNYRNSQLPLYNKSYVTTISEDSSGKIWVGTFGDGIFIWDKENNTINQITSQNSSLSSDSVFSILPAEDKIWITTDSGTLDCYLTPSEQFRKYEFSSQPFNSTRTGQRLIQDSKGIIWIATEGQGLFQFDPSLEKFTQYKSKVGENGLSSNIITDLKEGKNGKIWMATDGGGLNVLLSDSGKIAAYKHNLYDESSISNNSSYCLFIDEQENLWLGMGDGSVNKTFSSAFRTFTTNYLHPEQGLSFNVVVSLAMNNKELWIGTGGGGLDKMDLETQTFKNYRNISNDDKSLPSDIVMSLLFDDNSNLWVGSFKKGVKIKYPNSEKFIDPSTYANKLHSLNDNLIFDLEKDATGSIWIASYDDGLYQYDSNIRSMFHYSPSDEGRNGKLTSNTLTTTLCDTNGKVWIGTLDQGLQIYDPEYDRFHSLESLVKNSVPTFDYPIEDLFEDAYGTIWIGTEGGGLFALDQELGSIKNYRIADGLPSNSIYGIIEESKGNLWFATNRGISNFKSGSQTFYNYNVNDGLPTNDFESGSIVKDLKGNLFFGSKKGLVTFHPKDLTFSDSSIDLELTNFQIFNKDINANTLLEGHMVLDSSIVYDRYIELPYFLDNITLGFASPQYPNPHDIKYRYMLEGLDERWLETDSERPFANYANIPPGSYTFLLQGTTENEGFSNVSQEIRLRLKVTPVWWQSKFAMFIYTLLIIGFLYFIYSTVQNRVRLKNQLVFEKFAHEKDEELYKSKLNFFTTISHELRTSLTLILTPLHDLQKIDIENIRTKNAVMTMHRNGQRLLNLINQILDFRKIESNETELKISEVELEDLLAEICLPFEDSARKKGIEFITKMDFVHEKARIDVGKVEIILYNLLSNALKFASTKIAFKAVQGIEDNTMAFKISNDGVGIPKNELDKVFSNYYQVAQHKHINKNGSGLGLAIVKNLVDMLGGNVRAENDEQLTVFHVQLPIENVSVEELKTGADLDDAHIKEKNEERQANRQLPGTNFKLLVIEDNTEISNLVVNGLTDFYEIETASNGADGFDKAIELIPDVIISDIMMPVMDGLELCKQIKTDQRTSHIPVLLLTARASIEFKKEGFGFGADDYITKPFDIDLLKLRVKNLIDSRQILQKKIKKDLILQPSEVAINDSDQLFLEKLVKVMEENISNVDFTAPNLASELGMSNSVLYRKITAIAGTNINEFIKTMRLKRAAQLLRDSDFTINEVSDMAGFSNPKYFSTCFKSEYGKTPTWYRGK